MKVVLFVPPGGYFAERWAQGSTMPNLGILYIAAVLEQDGVDVRVIPGDVLGMTFEQIGQENDDGAALRLARRRPERPLDRARVETEVSADAR